MGKTAYPREFSEQLKTVMKDGRLLEAEPMQKHTTFRVGGPADWFAYIESVEMLREVIGLCKQYEVPYHIIGNGSNVLVSDAGIRGVVLRLSGEFEEVIGIFTMPEYINTVGVAIGTGEQRNRHDFIYFDEIGLYELPTR